MDKTRSSHRLEKMFSPTAYSLCGCTGPDFAELKNNVQVDCGWGRLIFAHTFQDNEQLLEEICREKSTRRDIAIYVKDAHVVLSLAPHRVFLDPSHTYRLFLSLYHPVADPPKGFIVRRLQAFEDAEAINNLYLSRKMVGVDPEFIWKNRASKILTYAVAEENETGAIVGTATGVDHTNLFKDPENGSSLWCLAVDYQALQPAIGTALVDYLASHFYARGRAFLDISVLHSNETAISLYRKMGFQRIPAFCLKHKNPINEPLFTSPKLQDRMNPYAEIIVNEARRRGIGVQVIDAQNGYFSLTWGGRIVTCRESLSELTSAVAMSRCDDKEVTARVLREAGLNLPAQQRASTPEKNLVFLKRHGAVVVKPAQGEQGKGVFVNIRKAEVLEAAVAKVRKITDKVLLEEFRPGMDLRIVVINFEVVAAAVRRPASVKGTGRHTVLELIEKQSRRRKSATGGESSIPLDAETRRCVQDAGYSYEDILPEGTSLPVRNTANLHTGGTLHDVTGCLHPALKLAAVKAARALDIPVVGLDFIIREVDQPDYSIIEANERPGLANHEPQPTAERFIDLLFPQSAV